eukprot:PhM_4_TR2449/c0_g1_i1/m.12663
MSHDPLSSSSSSSFVQQQQQRLDSPVGAGTASVAESSTPSSSLPAHMHLLMTSTGGRGSISSSLSGTTTATTAATPSNRHVGFRPPPLMRLNSQSMSSMASGSILAERREEGTSSQISGTTNNDVTPDISVIRSPLQRPESLFERSVKHMATPVSMQKSPGNEDLSTRHARMREAVVIGGFYFDGKLPVDSVIVRYWYCIVMGCTALAYVIFTLAVVAAVRQAGVHNAHGAKDVALWVLQGVVSAVFLADWMAHRNLISYRRDHAWFDAVCAAPYFVATAVCSSSVGVDDGDVVRSVHVVAGFLPALKMLRCYTSLFRTSMPDIIDTHYVIFYYRLMPSFKFMFWFLLFIHTLVMTRLVVAVDTEESYHDAITWVWSILTSAPFEVEAHGSWEPILAGVLMTISMVLQGYVVGAMSMLVFSYDVKDDNRNQMLTTLEMLKHYRLPKPVQHEVLSFQYHIIEDSKQVRANAAGNAKALSSLPPTMLRQIQLYIKLGILSKVAFFDGSSEKCKLRIANVMDQLVVEPDTYIIRVGDIGHSMFFMQHGLADVLLESGVCVATLRRGDFFGEVALLDPDAKRKAT